jgi:hypothetical protein
MNLQVKKICPFLNKNTFQVMVEMGQTQHQFTMTVETDNLFNQPLQIIQGDDKFHSLFQWNRELAQRIYELVYQVYNQEELNFPISLGKFDEVQEPALNLS